MTSQSEIKLPGDVLVATEEYMPGEGTYEHGGMILASRIGTLVLDDREKIASIVFSKEPVLPLVGDIALGTVLDAGGKMVQIEIRSLERNGRGMPASNRGALHITKMSEDFIDNPRKFFRLGDIVRARIIQLEPSIQLSTAGEELGIVRAFCGKCRLPLERKGSQLHCAECERNEPRKLSGYYGLTPFSSGEISESGEKNIRSGDNKV